MSTRKLTIFAVVWKDLPYVRFSWTMKSFPRSSSERRGRIGSLKVFLNSVITLPKTENKELQTILVSQGSEILTTLKEENVTFVELETFTGTEINQKDIINSLRKHERLYLERNYISLNCGKFKVRIPSQVNTTPKLKKKVIVNGKENRNPQSSLQ